MRRISRRNKLITKTSSFVVTDHGLVSFQLVRSSARRILTLSIDDEARVQLAVPFHCADAQIFGFIKQKSRWIAKKLEGAKHHRDLLRSRRFEDGHEFLFLGKPVRLSVFSDDIRRARVDFDGSCVKVALPKSLEEHKRERSVRSHMMQWYRKQAEEILGTRTFHFAKKMNLQPSRVAIRSFKRLWGNCDYRTRLIQLNWQVIHSPMEVIDYVIVHELCHLVHPNHSRRFWDKVEEHMPDFRDHKNWLKEHSLNMVLP